MHAKWHVPGLPRKVQDDRDAVAELDYFVLCRFGQSAETAMLDELLDGAYELPQFTRTSTSA